MRALRVFALAPDCHVEGWRYGDVWRTHFYEGLRSAGADVVIPQGLCFSWARPPQSVRPEETAGPRRSASGALVRQIREAARGGLDAVISYCFSHDLDLEVVDEIRAAGVPWINFFCDSAYAFHAVEALARRTSLNWFVESVAEDRYRELGVPYLRAPYALNSAALPDASCRRPERTLAFVGAAHPNRVRLALLLRLAGVDLHVRGWGWPAVLEASGRRGVASRARAGVRRILAKALLLGRAGGHLPESELLDYLRTSQVLLGLNEGRLPGGAPVRYLKLRDVELPGRGCAYLTQHNPDLPLAFDVPSEIRTFHSVREARALATELASDAAECRRMGRRARERVLAEHTWRVRLPQLLAALP